jgi:hypothetical protein
MSPDPDHLAAVYHWLAIGLLISVFYSRKHSEFAKS